jgi:hypothetical protein
MLGGLDMIPRKKRGSQATEPEANNAYPVHRPNRLSVAGTDLSGVVAIVIAVVLGRASRVKKPALGKDGLTM